MKIGLHGSARESNGRITLKICWDDIGSDILEAGSPLGIDGRIHNDSKAVGIVLGDCQRRYCGNAEVIINGYVNKTEAETASGIQLTEEAISAMAGIRFTDNEALLNSIDRMEA